MKPQHAGTKSVADTDKKEIALELREALNTLSPFIEKHTAVVCPECRNLCCADRHGRYDEKDVFFLTQLGADIPAYTDDRGGTGACRFMTETGCSLERWMRPYRCTFFFCTPLLKSLENDSAKLYRAFLDYFQNMVMLRQKLLE
jgi:hypothetical protein